MSEYRKGDRCRILDGGKVQHFDCHTYADGVVTDIRTGKILADSRQEIWYVRDRRAGDGPLD